MHYTKQRQARTRKRGDTVKAVQIAGRRVALSGLAGESESSMPNCRSSTRGFSLIEMVITITVMTILTMGVLPLVKVSVKRQKEQQLRDTLRQMRIAIDEFHRDTVGMQCTGTVAQPPAGTNPNPNALIDPRSKVVISDCTIFGVDNPDRYPPDLETLVNGVNVIPRGGGLGGGRGDPNVKATEVGSAELSTKKKVYLRAIPIDPITGKAEWDFHSCYDAADSDSWGRENIFDVRSKSKDDALNREKYSDW